MFNLTVNEYVDGIEAASEFEIARRRGRRHEFTAALVRRRISLLSLNEVSGGAPVQGEHYVGLRQISVECIVGSLGRQGDFDLHFHPLNHRTRNRWVKVAEAYLSGTNLPPIELLKVGDVYLVRDGNHRVSVARHFGVQVIDAEVTEYMSSTEPDIPAPACMSVSQTDWSHVVQSIFRKTEELGEVVLTREARN